MKTDGSAFYASLFYSYSHKDAKYRDDMETALSGLKREKLLKDWSDLNILPGQTISKEIRKKIDESEILVFLLSPDFIASDECMKEWEYAKQLAAEGRSIFRIPIILRDCSWKDLLSNDDIKALPNDGTAIADFDDKRDTAWLQVYEGIKVVINQLRETFTPKPEFLREMEKTDFLSLEHVKLQDIFVFPTLTHYLPQAKEGILLEETVKDLADLLAHKYLLIHGEEMSGKTALGRHLFLSLANDRSTPVLHLDLKEVSRKSNETVFSEIYHRQFSGDYHLWKQQDGKTLILDNLSSTLNSVELIEFARGSFDRIVVTLSSDTFYSFFRDDTRLADFREVRVEPMNHWQQEELIRKRLAVSDRSTPVTDGVVDHIENHVNSIVISNKIVPRYPFFILSILQTYEAFMPTELSITSYGHCYHVLIVASLMKAGISRDDNDINACFNFAENLAFKIFQCTKLQTPTELDFGKFVIEYREKYLISDSILNRLKKPDYGIITSDGSFRAPYMYYFFLGRFLSKVNEENKFVIEKMCEHSYVSSNHLTLLFIIHHTNDNQIIDDILLRTMCALDSVDPATLDRYETNSFKEIVNALQGDILSSSSVEEERKKERETRDLNDDEIETEDNSKEPIGVDTVNDVYRILKNNEIMAQILRNKYGSLEKTKIKEIIETVADSGLRLVKLGLMDRDWITQEAKYLQKKYPNHSVEEIKTLIQFLSFLWTMGYVEKIVGSINEPEIKQVVNYVVLQKSTPAYDLIGYFNHLDSSRELTDPVKRELENLLKRHKDPFFKKVLSIRTQHYMNTHRSPARIEQSVCSLLDLNYSYRISRDSS